MTSPSRAVSPLREPSPAAHPLRGSASIDSFREASFLEDGNIRESPSFGAGLREEFSNTETLRQGRSISNLRSARSVRPSRSRAQGLRSPSVASTLRESPSEGDFRVGRSQSARPQRSGPHQLRESLSVAATLRASDSVASNLNGTKGKGEDEGDYEEEKEGYEDFRGRNRMSLPKEEEEPGRPSDDTTIAHHTPRESFYEKPPPFRKGAKDPAFLVQWEENDPENPKNWTTRKKCLITFQLAQIAMAASLGSSIISPAGGQIEAFAHIGVEVDVFTVSLYVLGFAVGAVIWAPISEIWGRRISLIPAMVGLGIFSIGTAASENAAAIMLTRFFGGVCGAAPVVNVAAALGDIWHPSVRGTAVSCYSMSVIGGPTIGPVIGAAITSNPHMGWRWTMYILAIWVFVAITSVFFFMPEIYHPVLLKKRAIKLRDETGDYRYWHPQEDVKLNPKELLTKHFARPMTMLFTEPMVMCIALYASFVYSLLYMTLEVFPMVYLDRRGWPLVSSTLPFLALFVGVVCALGINLSNQPRYQRAVAANNGKPVPEARLLPMVIGGTIFTVGMFWFGWTADPPISWVSSVFAAAFIGAGFNIIFQQCMNFLVDTYATYAASAVSANTFLRSMLGAGLPLVCKPMFGNLGVGPAMSILGGCAALMIPVPLIFMKYGAVLRQKSRYAPGSA